MERVKLESRGGVEIELDFENEEILVEGVVQDCDFEDKANFLVDQMSEGKVEQVE